MKKKNQVVKLLNEINDKIIQKNSDSGSYTRGSTLYLSNKVVEIDIDINDQGEFEETKITSRVEDSKFNQYKVNASFNNINPFIIYHCECNAYYSYYGQTSMCKHVVATLLKYVHEKEQIIKVKKMNKTSNLIKQIAKNISSEPREKIYLTVDIKYVHDSNVNNKRSCVELKIGEDKLYVVKNIKEFLIAYNKATELIEFGKRFTYNPLLHCFKADDLDIIEIFKEASELETVIANADTYRSSKVKFLSGKKAYFTDSMVKRLFKCLNKRTLTVVIKGEVFSDVNIVQEFMPLEFEINREDKKFELQQKQHMPTSLCNDGQFFFYEGKIYEPPIDQRECLFAFL